MLSKEQIYIDYLEQYGKDDPRTKRARADFEKNIGLAAVQADSLRSAIGGTSYLPPVQMAKKQSIDDELVMAESADDSSGRTGTLHNWKEWIVEQLQKRKQSMAEHHAESEKEWQEQVEFRQQREADVYEQVIAYQESWRELGEGLVEVASGEGGQIPDKPPDELRKRRTVAPVMPVGIEQLPISPELAADTDAAWQNYLDQWEMYGWHSPQAKKGFKRYKQLEEETFYEGRVGKNVLYAPKPKGALEKEREGMLEKVFAPFLTGERASGTAIYELRKKYLGEIDWIEQREGGERFKEISPAEALGVSTPETKITSLRGAAAFALDWYLDPLTYVGIGVIGKLGKASKSLKIGRLSGKAEKVVGPLGIDYIQHAISIGISRETAERKLLETIERGHPEYLAAKKYVEPSINIFGQKLFYTEPYKLLAKKAWDILPYAKKRERGVDILQTAFVPFHKIVRDVGEAAKKPFQHFYRKTASETATEGARIEKLFKETPESSKEEIVLALEKGIEPTSPEAKNTAKELRKIYDEAFEEQVALGMIKPEQYREFYMHHAATKEGRDWLKEHLGSQYERGLDIAAYRKKLGSAESRMLEGDVYEVNKRMSEAYGIKEFFVEDPYLATQMFTVQHVRATRSYILHRQVMEEFGRPIEEGAPSAGRSKPKYTPAEIKQQLKEFDDETERLLKDVETAPTITKKGKIAKTKMDKAVDIRDRTLKIQEDIRAGRPVDETELANLEKSIQAEGRGVFRGISPRPTEKIENIDVLVRAQRIARKDIDDTELAAKSAEEAVVKDTARIARDQKRLDEARETSKKHPRDYYYAAAVENQEQSLTKLETDLQNSEKRLKDANADAAQRIPRVEREIAERTETLLGEFPAITDPMSLYITKQEGVYNAGTRIPKTVEQLKAARLPKRGTLEERLAGVNVAAPPKVVQIDGLEHTLFKDKGEEAYLPTVIVDELERTRPATGFWTEVYDPALGAVKKAWISIWPGFYSRNVYGGVGWQNILAGVEPEDYARNLDILYGNPNKVYDVPLYGKRTGGELKKLMESHNVYGQTGFVGEPSSYVTGLGPLGQAYKKYPEQAMHLTENQLRGPLFMHFLWKTGDPEFAAEMVYKYHFEYLRGAYTPFEENVLARGIPFYSWLRGNIPLQTEMAIRQPGKFAALAKAREMATTPEEYNQLTPWQKEKLVYVHNGKAITLDLPATDLPFLYGREEAYFGLTPFVKWGMNMLEGKDMYGRKMEPITTWEGAKQNAAMTAMTFAGRYVYAAREIAATQQGERPLSYTLLHQLAGVGVYELKESYKQTEEAFKTAKYTKPTPTEREKALAWAAQGRVPGAQVFALSLPADEDERRWRATGTMQVEENEQMVNRVVERLEGTTQGLYRLRGFGTLVSATPEEREFLEGFKPTDEQLRTLTEVDRLSTIKKEARTPEDVKKLANVLGVLTETYPLEDIEMEDVTVRNVYLAMGMKVKREYESRLYHREPFTEEERMAAVARRPSELRDLRFKEIRYETGEKAGILALTPKEFEKYSGGLSEAQKAWMFRESAVELPAEAYEKYMKPFEGLEVEKSPLYKQFYEKYMEPFKEVKKSPLYMQFYGKVYEDATSEASRASRQKVYDTMWGEQFKKSFPEIYAERMAEGKPLTVKMLPTAQRKIWEKEFEANRKLEEDRREELGGLRADIRGTTKIRKNDPYVSGLLMMTRGGEDIGERMTRKRELEDLLGVGVDR